MYRAASFTIGQHQFGCAFDNADWGADVSCERDVDGETIRYIKLGPFAASWCTIVEPHFSVANHVSS